jgi:hypothetical protein
MLREAENIVRIEGILSETDLKYGSFEKNGTTVNSIGGIIKIQVNQEINGESKTLEVPVHMFASEYTNKGAKNPAYQSIERVMNEFTSIAAAGGAANADRVRVTNGKITMNEYYGRDGQLISFPRITASFVNKIKADEMKPCATFTTNFVVAKKMNEVDREGVETGRYKVTGIIPQFGGRVDVVEFITSNKNVINAVSQYWTENDTVSAQGRLNFSSKTETVVKEVDFGEPQETTRTISVSELILTGGSSTPLEGEFAYDMSDIQTALAERKQRLEESKNKNGGTRKAPQKNSGAPIDLGF